MPIPKIIHYCWFGNTKKTKLVRKCIDSWKRICPDFKILEWNEENFDINSSPLYVRQAYEAGKWAFVSDYARLKIVFDNGGVYFDTDVELIERIDDLLVYDSFFCSEGRPDISTGLGFGAVKGNQFVEAMLHGYDDIPFYINERKNFDTTGCPTRNMESIRPLLGEIRQFECVKLVGNNIFLPRDYFCPLDYASMLMKYKSKNTRAIHWFSASWYSNAQKRERFISLFVSFPKRLLMRILGFKRYDAIKKSIKSLLRNK